VTTERPWFREAFESHYLDVYSHRDDRAAAAEVDFALRVLEAPPGALLLDLACGAGRHSRALAARGLDVVGLDLSPDLLNAARGESSGAAPAYLRGDMRELPFADRFAAVTMFFTSFGYFETDPENARVLAEVARVLRPGGRFLLDYLNREAVISGLVPESEEESEGFRLTAKRRITADGRRVEKRVVIHEGGRLVRDYRESVRMYTPEEIDSMLGEAGFRRSGRWGDLAGRPFAADSPRLVVLGRKAC
jgi:SAM-dependent methyltransferase